jgi:hypothetical protein
MTAKRLRNSTVFTCDICSDYLVEENPSHWQERRAPYARAKDLGWRFEKLGNQYRAFCPNCVSSSGYGPDDILA